MLNSGIHPCTNSGSEADSPWRRSALSEYGLVDDLVGLTDSSILRCSLSDEKLIRSTCIYTPCVIKMLPRNFDLSHG